MESIGVTVRIPVDVRDWICQQAKNDARSMNGQVITILKQAMASAKTSATGGAA